VKLGIFLKPYREIVHLFCELDWSLYTGKTKFNVIQSRKTMTMKPCVWHGTDAVPTKTFLVTNSYDLHSYFSRITNSQQRGHCKRPLWNHFGVTLLISNYKQIMSTYEKFVPAM